MPKVAQQLIVVRRDQPELYRELQARAAGDGTVQVILDRRSRDRRVVIQDVSLDRRRRTDRRAPIAPRWDPRGFLLARSYRAARPRPGNGFHNCLELPPGIALSR
jgi:hypothetical protein